MVKVFSFLVIGGCVAGFSISTLSVFVTGGEERENNNSTTSQQDTTVKEAIKQERKKKILRDLGNRNCYVATGVKEYDKKFGTAYMCTGGFSDGIPLYYLEEENFFDNLHSELDSFSLLKEVEKIQYKQGENSDDYVLLTFGGQTKKILVSPSSLQSWNIYKSFLN